MENKNLQTVVKKLSDKELQDSLNEFSEVIIEIGKEIRRRNQGTQIPNP